LRAIPCETELGKILQDQRFFCSDQGTASSAPPMRRHAGGPADGGPIVCARAIELLYLMT
jgi:hypothetical protein